eukprot:MONOS_283.1-p1 / transcript=MONOS_283.1 / gene=MONOS_283 / organism=Monocercomonoides_exilis_PA203 / gene_product=unspecified product / transcript_product=unspecified product / location=Mono_scaffold00004:304663-307148(-) / protein_length=434 / sequence_SO=supercontig / SO=protein_coding / is_pseudo=false
MEDGFEVCEHEREDCLSRCGVSTLTVSGTQCAAQCSDERLACKSEYRQQFSDCELYCSASSDDTCTIECEKQKQKCLSDASENYDICRYSVQSRSIASSSTSSSSSSSSTSPSLYPPSLQPQQPTASATLAERECSRMWREANADCRDAFDACISNNCQRTFGTCQNDCLDFTEDCYASAEIELQKCLTNCKGASQCEAKCKNNYRMQKDSCRNGYIQCESECEADSTGVCFADCDKAKQQGLLECDKELDACNVEKQRGRQTDVGCLRNRRLCEANVRDIADQCKEVCTGSYEADIEKCKTSLQRSFDQCQLSFEQCELRCQLPSSSVPSSTCVSTCMTQRRDCHTLSTRAFEDCESNTKLKWVDQCGINCENQRQKCLDASDSWFDWCFHEKCVGNDACQRQCRQKRRTNTHTCTNEFEICNNECAFKEFG